MKTLWFSLLLAACNQGPMPRFDAPISTGEPCNMATGQGCVCNPQVACPQAGDVCANLGGSFGSFCANACTQATQATDCALAPGQLGVGACVLTVQGFPGKYCAILCGYNGNPSQNFAECPVSFTGMTLSSTGCVCVPAGALTDGGT
jgi:hypothetical protein